MRRRTKYLLLMAGSALICALVVFALVDRDLELQGGMSSRYRAKDYDPELTHIAREADPLIFAIEQFISAHGTCPQPNRRDLSLVEVHLKGDFETEIRDTQVFFRKVKSPVAWIYSASSVTKIDCILWRKLGWDPSLTWRRLHDRAEWSFDPGDGSEGVIVRFGSR